MKTRLCLAVDHRIRERIEQEEAARLSPFAARAADSQGRARLEPQDPVRTVFQRDRDRVLHCKSFRRLKYKTQVFIAPHGDHYRTRLTHTLEVAQIARTIGRALRLNEDLIEAIALGHDLGHPPFGHIGERAIHRVLAAHGQSFHHSEQSLRVIEVLEDLNLTLETVAGIGGHSKGRHDLSAHDGVPTSTLEAAVVRISDRIAYLNHDLDDALRSGMIEAVPARFLALGDRSSARIRTMVIDVITESEDQPAIRLSAAMLSLLNDLKEWLFENVYDLYPTRYPDIGKAEKLVADLVEHYLPSLGWRGAADYVAGMTDRFAMDTWAAFRLPEGFRTPR